eukprot:TRINITY_DN8856_c0_g1_i1.p1 TRINITY_DN8856_c0_g1~~TRINITY_DN8856_c0_g1_i1.p1  ORF type:complete len:642 (-),score=121.63 TRINITY_DN8856_c0_g1_i1:451-2112(-)
MSLRVRFFQDARLPKAKVPVPLRIPWMPVKHFVAGPPGVGRFRRQTLRPGVDGWRTTSTRDLEFVVSEKSLKESAERLNDWDAETFQPLVTAGEFAHCCSCAGLVLLLCGVISQIASGFLLRPLRHRSVPPGVGSGSNSNPLPLGPRLLLRSAALFYIGSSALSLGGATRYAAAYHHKLKLLVSEFLFMLTDGDVSFWPEDMLVALAGGSLLALASGLIALTAGLVLLFGDLSMMIELDVSDQVSVTAAGEATVVPLSSKNGNAGELAQTEIDKTAVLEEHAQRSEAVRFRRARTEASSLQASTDLQEEKDLLTKAFAATTEQLRSHNRRVAGTVLISMVVFVLILAAVAFFIGRIAVAQGIQNALRGPQLTVKQTSHAFKKAQLFAGSSARGAGNATLSSLGAAARHAQRAKNHARAELRSTGDSARAAAESLAAAAKRPDWHGIVSGTAGFPARVARGAFQLAKNFTGRSAAIYRRQVRPLQPSTLDNGRHDEGQDIATEAQHERRLLWQRRQKAAPWSPDDSPPRFLPQPLRWLSKFNQKPAELNNGDEE